MDNFAEQFKLHDNGFYSYNPFTNTTLGFSVKKQFTDNDNGYVSLVAVYLSDNDLNNSELKRKPLKLHATYGKEEDNGVVMRDQSKLDFSRPIDIQSDKDCFYDIEQGKFFLHNKEISPEQIINNFYSDHIKITKPIKGFWLRLKFIRAQILLPKYSNFIFRCWGILLFTMTGVSYLPEFNRIHDDKFLSYLSNNESIYDRKIINNKIKNREQDSILGIKFTRWGIFLFCAFHLTVFIFYYINKDIMPVHLKNIISTIGKNNFLVVIYSYFILTVQDVIIPWFITSRINNRIDQINKVVDQPIRI